MLEGNVNSNYEIIIDRGKAIEKGISLLENNDILLVLGKGHEDYQEIKGKKYPMDERVIIEEICAENASK